jgi:hypothetical protein
MPIEQRIWRISEGKPERISFAPLATESRLEETLVADFDVLDPELLIIGRQVATAFGKLIDILAIDRDGSLTVIELKRDKTPREVVAQVLDYASWVKTLTHEQIVTIFATFRPGEHFEQVFEARFGSAAPDELNEQHRLVIVASDLDPATERIIKYLSDGYGVPLNVAFFGYFRDNGSEYLTRTWLIEPTEAEAKASKAASVKGGREPWNGRDYYVSFGEFANRSWDDAVKYGFVSAGGGRWFSNTLNILTPGARVFAHIPKVGYVGVGIVRDGPVPVGEFTVPVNGRSVPILELPLKAQDFGGNAIDPDRAEYLVRVDWIKTLQRDEAIWEKGMFANQNSACRLRNKFTLDTLVQRFGVDS